MKKLIYVFTAISVLATVNISCEKVDVLDEMQNPKEETNLKSSLASSINLYKIDVNEPEPLIMLEFSSHEDYENTLSMLIERVNSYDDEFISNWAHLNEEEINAKEEKLNFNNQKPLLDFEKQFTDLTTLRNIFTIKEREWLDNNELIAENSPFIEYPFSYEEMTLLNEDGMVKIADNILLLSSKGFIQVPAKQKDIVTELSKGNFQSLSKDFILTNINTNKSSGCAMWRSKDITHNYNSNRKVIKHMHFHSYPWKGTSETQITSYKKSGSKWKKNRMQIGVANQSNFTDSNCNFGANSTWTGWKSKNRNSVSQRVMSWGAFPQYRVRLNQSVFGSYSYAGYNNSHAL